jgi:lysyl-tRNA synthetase class 2
VASSVIRWFDYSLSTRELRVVFQSGRHYVYRDVPQEIFRGLQAAPSKGEFFNAAIRDQYRFVHRD